MIIKHLPGWLLWCEIILLVEAVICHFCNFSWIFVVIPLMTSLTNVWLIERNPTVQFLSFMNSHYELWDWFSRRHIVHVDVSVRNIKIYHFSVACSMWIKPSELIGICQMRDLGIITSKSHVQLSERLHWLLMVIHFVNIMILFFTLE